MARIQRYSEQLPSYGWNELEFQAGSSWCHCRKGRKLNFDGAQTEISSHGSEIEAVYGKLNQLSGITFCALQRRQQVFPCLDRVSISLSAQACGQRNLYTHPYSGPSEPQGVYGLNSGYEFACSAGSEICMFHDFWGAGICGYIKRDGLARRQMASTSRFICLSQQMPN